MKIFFTNIPAFYKIKLFNEVNKRSKILVVFIESNENDRNLDFVKGEMMFDYVVLKGSIFSKILNSFRIISNNRYTELVLCGWDYMLLWLLAYRSPKLLNSTILESSYLESSAQGVAGVLKRIFLKRMSKIYAPGISNVKLARKLGFKGKIVITKGVGIFNYIPQPSFIKRTKVENYLYVGRLVEVKNVDFLITVFNKLPHLKLHVVGFGVLEKELKSIAGKNIFFYGAVNNKDLPDFYQKADVFILPSKSEPWGMVVEEALNNGIPVIVSNRVGCAEEIVSKENGLIFESNNKESLLDAISKMSDVDFYNKLRYNISNINFDEMESKQVECYLD